MRTEQGRACQVLVMNTLAFTVCFACWMMNGVLITFLVENKVYSWDKAQIGWLIGIPVLTGAILRLPIGVLADKYGGRAVFTALMLIAAFPTYLVSRADTYLEFFLTSLGFGMIGASFAVGIAYTSLWFSPQRQGLTLGIFGMGNLGAALTSIVAPHILGRIAHGENLSRWRELPKLYAALLVITAILFWLLTYTKKVQEGKKLSLRQRLAPLQYVQVWRFGLYYFFFFGGFVALAQWLIPYFVNVYSVTIAAAGVMAAIFSLPAGVIRAIGGWLADKWGARPVLYVVFTVSIILLMLLFPPRMELQSPGQGVMAERGGVVSAVSEHAIIVDEREYPIQPHDTAQPQARVRFGIHNHDQEGFIFFPTAFHWQEPVVKAGDNVVKGQLLARGITKIYFQANKWIFASLVFLLGVMMGIGSAAVYKHIPTYYPSNVGVVGGIVGVLGGLGGFCQPIIFGYLLKGTGVWTTCWMFLTVVGLVSLVWMHLAIRRMMRAKTSP